MVLLATMLASSGVPMTSSFGLVVGIVWIVDRGMTMVNITGDSAVAAIVDRVLGDGVDFEQTDTEKCAEQDNIHLGRMAPGDEISNPMGGTRFYAPPDPDSADGESSEQTFSLT